MGQIMSWLPPNALGQAKCVSKSWNTLISGFVNDPDFVARHLHNMKNSPSTSFISSESGQFSLLTLFNDDGNEGHINGVTEGFHLPLRQEEATYLLVFRCDGILCLVKDSRIIMLWNPAIQEFKLLPESNISSAQGGADIGFRYDSSAKDYKVVRICYPRYGNLDDDARAEAYML